MTSRLLRLLTFLALASLSLGAAEPTAWPTPTAEMKPWTRWWWPASAVDQENLTRELTAYAEAGLGGVEITPIYGAKGYEQRFIPFLSPKYVEMLAFTGAEAKRLGLVVDMATGTGWPFGGPQITPQDAELKITVKDGQLAASPTGFKVKRAAPGGAGLVLNPYSTIALTHYLAPFDAAFASLPKDTSHGQFHDSFEYTANWSSEFEAKFRAMHGYDLRDHAAEFGGKGDTDTIARIKSDYRETLSALHLDYVRAWVEWCHKNGQVAREQAHGAPGNLLDLYGASDVPETEIFGSLEYPIPGFRSTPDELSYNKPQPLISRFASSAAHVTGKNLVSSETFTWLRQHFHEAPSQMKPELDQLFLAGINHVVYHGTCYSPADAPWPGWLFYASTQYNPRNSLWRDISEGVNTYITRCQSLLQQGQPDNDILVYWPIYDLWHNADGYEMRFGMHDAKWITDSPAGKLAQKLVERGVQFSFISDALLAQATVSEAISPLSQHGIQTAAGRVYKSIIVPQTRLMPAATLKRLQNLAEQGVVVLFIETLPEDVPGLGQLAEQRALFQQIRTDILANHQKEAQRTSGPPSKIIFYNIGQGGVVVGPVQEILDRTFWGFGSEPVDASGLRFIRRQLANGDSLYFLINLSNKTFDGEKPLRYRGTTDNLKAVQLLDPLDGRSGFANFHMVLESSMENSPYVHLQLAPGESVFVRTFAKNQAAGPKWNYYKPLSQPSILTVPSSITFLRGGPELPPAYNTTELKSWTEQGGEAERFAGTARYETEFEVPAGIAADEWQLDLGDVRETARVFINDQQVELLWSLPFRTRIGAFLKPGKNRLAIEVTNLSANRIRDLDKRGVVWKNFYEINFVNPHYEKLNASTWPIMPSGLLGPVTLTPLKKFDPVAEKK